jgi:hypothetical protein
VWYTAGENSYAKEANMAATLPVEAAGPELRELLKQLPAGETVELVGSEGEQVAVVLTVQPSTDKPMSPEEWLAEVDALAQEIDKAWKSEKSAVEIISEMRR